MKIGIYGQFYHKDPEEYIQLILDVLQKNGANVFIEEGFLKIIEQHESSKRGVYSGAIGYFTPSSDFDFNVVIRSILYNKALKRCSFMVGGAITLKSDPEKEYEETLTKAQALIKALSSNEK